MTTTIRIACDCQTCKANAAKIGASFPLKADLNTAAATGLKITERNASKASKVHGLVHLAHDPSVKGYGGTLPAVAVR